MPVYCGVDFHARVQTISYLTTEDGEVQQLELHHEQDDVRAFYAQFSGEVIVGFETSVVIAVSAPHRRAAFEACEWAIRELKRTVPIWKKEVFEDGEVWVEGEGHPQSVPPASAGGSNTQR